MSYWNQFEVFDPKNGTISSYQYKYLEDIAFRSREILKHRSVEEITNIALYIDWLIYSDLERELIELSGPLENTNKASKDFFEQAIQSDEELTCLDLYESQLDEDEDDSFDLPYPPVTNELIALKERFHKYDFEDIENHEVFSVLALWMIADCLRWCNYENKTSFGDFSIDYAFRAIEAICFAEHLLAVDKINLDLEKHQEALKAEKENAKKQIELEICKQKSSDARKAAYKRHSEHIILRQETIEYYEANKQSFKSTEDAARKIAGVIVPITHRTVVKWISEYKKLHSAR